MTRSKGPGPTTKTGPRGRPAPPKTIEEALERAATHGRNALAEALLAARALLDAAAIAISGQPLSSSTGTAESSEPKRALARAVGFIDELAERLRTDEAAATRSLVDALLEALDAEIARWEGRAGSDPDARAVLRAFLGLRELLWELGLRRGESTDASRSADEAAAAPKPSSQAKRRRRSPAPAAKRRGQRRVERVEIEG
jgi:hypothetical protein